METKVLGPTDLSLVLTEAVIGGHAAIVEYLIQQGADIHYFDKMAPLMVTAVLRRNTLMFYTLLKHCKKINMEYNKGSLAHAAVKIKSLAVLQELDKFHEKFLLYDKADEVNRRTPLHEAVVVISAGKIPVPQSPGLEVQANPLENLESHSSQPFSESVELSQEMADKPKTLCLRSLSNETEVLETEIVRFLLEKGCNANTKDKHGRTPLHDAAAGGKESLVLLLTGAGALLYEEDSRGSLPWTEAVDRGFEEIASYLLKEDDLYMTFSGRRKNCNHIFAAIDKSLACVQYLIKRGVNLSCPDFIDQEGMTPLIKAIHTGKHNCASLLVRFSGPQINVKTTTEYTAIDYALNAWQSRDDTHWGKILNDMIKQGASLNMYVGIHRVHLLMQREYLINPWKLDWILLHSPDLNVKSKEGWWLFQVAMHHISVHRPNHIGIKVLFKMLNHGMWIPVQFTSVKPTKDLTGKTVVKSSPILEALRARHIVLAYLLHLLGCHSGESEINQWYYSNSSDFIRTSSYAVELVEYLLESEKQPMRLHDLTRMVIVRSLPPGDVREYAKRLPLPIQLKRRLDWEHEVDCKPKALPDFYKVIKEMLCWPEDEKDSSEWEGFCFSAELTFEY